MLFFYALNVYVPLGTFQGFAVVFGILQAFSIGLFLYNMLATLLPAPPPPQF
jgi:hypothetical protein